MNRGRAKLTTIPGKKKPPCDNCGTTTATMYNLKLEREFGGMDLVTHNINLCVNCRSSIGRQFEEFSNAHKDCY